MFCKVIQIINLYIQFFNIECAFIWRKNERKAKYLAVFIGVINFFHIIIIHLQPETGDRAKCIMPTLALYLADTESHNLNPCFEWELKELRNSARADSEVTCLQNGGSWRRIGYFSMIQAEFACVFNSGFTHWSGMLMTNGRHNLVYLHDDYYAHEHAYNVALHMT